MKVRNGFVSNSSSSSFTCDFCDENYVGYDGEYGDDIAKTECGNGHVLCGHLLKKKEESKEDTEKKRRTLIEESDSKSESQRLEKCSNAQILEMWEDNEDEYVDPSQCPICQFHKIMDDELVHFLLVRVLECSRGLIVSQIKQEFGTYEKFSDFLKKNPVLESLGAKAVKVEP